MNNDRQLCPMCSGAGKVDKTRCLICNGFGLVDDWGMKRYELTQIGIKAGRSPKVRRRRPPIVPLRGETDMKDYF